MEPWSQASAPNCFPSGFFHPREDWEAHLCPPSPTPCIQSSGFREAVNDSLELTTRGGISAQLCEELRRGFNVFVGLASPRKSVFGSRGLEAWSHCVARVRLELLILLPQRPTTEHCD